MLPGKMRTATPIAMTVRRWARGADKRTHACSTARGATATGDGRGGGPGSRPTPRQPPPAPPRHHATMPPSRPAAGARLHRYKTTATESR